MSEWKERWKWFIRIRFGAAWKSVNAHFAMRSILLRLHHLLLLLYDRFLLIRRHSTSQRFSFQFYFFLLRVFIRQFLIGASHLSRRENNKKAQTKNDEENENWIAKHKISRHERRIHFVTAISLMASMCKQEKNILNCSCRFSNRMNRHVHNSNWSLWWWTRRRKKQTKDARIECTAQWQQATVSTHGSRAHTHTQQQNALSESSYFNENRQNAKENERKECFRRRDLHAHTSPSSCST